jgi:hypothetical protein
MKIGLNGMTAIGSLTLSPLMIPMQRQMQDFSSNKDTMVKRGKLGKSQSLILPSVGKAKTKLLPQVAPEPKKFESA